MFVNRSILVIQKLSRLSLLLLLQDAVYINRAVLMNIHHVLLPVKSRDDEEDQCADNNTAHDRRRRRQSVLGHEKDDGDDIYYLERTNELVIVSTDGYIRTYFRPDSGIKYYNKQ